MPSFLETILSGLSALKALNPFAKEISKLYMLDSIQVMTLNISLTNEISYPKQT